jgi:hypothetical protein
MKLGGSLGNILKKLKKNCYKISIYFGLLVHFQEYNLSYQCYIIFFEEHVPRKLLESLTKFNEANWMC